MKITGGHSPQHSYEELLNDPRFRTYEGVLVVLSYYGATDPDYSFIQEPSELHVAMKRLCAEMEQAPRALLVTGMSSGCFGFSSSGDAMVEKYVHIGRGQRIATIGGEEFFSTLQHPGNDSWHYLAVDGQDEKIPNLYVEYVETSISAQPSAWRARLSNMIHEATLQAIVQVGGYQALPDGDGISILGNWIGFTRPVFRSFGLPASESDALPPADPPEWSPPDANQVEKQHFKNERRETPESSEDEGEGNAIREEVARRSLQERHADEFKEDVPATDVDGVTPPPDRCSFANLESAAATNMVQGNITLARLVVAVTRCEWIHRLNSRTTSTRTWETIRLPDTEFQVAIRITCLCWSYMGQRTAAEQKSRKKSCAASLRMHQRCCGHVPITKQTTNVQIAELPDATVVQKP